MAALALNDHPAYRVGHLEAQVAELTVRLNQANQVNHFLLSQLAATIKGATDTHLLNKNLNDVAPILGQLTTGPRAGQPPLNVSSHIHNTFRTPDQTNTPENLLDVDPPLVDIEQISSDPVRFALPSSESPSSPPTTNSRDETPAVRSDFPPAINPEADDHTTVRSNSERDTDSSSDNILTPSNTSISCKEDNSPQIEPESLHRAHAINAAQSREIRDFPLGQKQRVQTRNFHAFSLNRRPQDEYMKQWYTVGLRFDPGMDLSRTVLISRVPEDAALAEVMEPVRGGVVMNCMLLRTSLMKLRGGGFILGNTVRIEFAHQLSARRFIDTVNERGFFVKGNKVEVKLLESSTFPIPPTLRENTFSYRHSRVLHIAGLKTVLTKDAMLDRASGDQVLKLTHTKEGVIAVFSSIQAAEDAKEELMVTKHAQVMFLRDPCEQY